MKREKRERKVQRLFEVSNSLNEKLCKLGFKESMALIEQLLQDYFDNRPIPKIGEIYQKKVSPSWYFMPYAILQDSVIVFCFQVTDDGKISSFYEESKHSLDTFMSEFSVVDDDEFDDMIPGIETIYDIIVETAENKVKVFEAVMEAAER